MDTYSMLCPHCGAAIRAEEKQPIKLEELYEPYPVSHPSPTPLELRTWTTQGAEIAKAVDMALNSLMRPTEPTVDSLKRGPRAWGYNRKGCTNDCDPSTCGCNG